MKKSIFIVITLAAAVALTFTACIGPARRAEKAQQAVEKAKDAENANQLKQLEKAKAKVFATGEALKSEPIQTAPIQLASQFNDQAQTILGPPRYEDAVFYQQVIRDLLSTNAQAKAAAEVRLAQKDAEIVALQNRLSKLQATTAKAEDKRDTVMSDVASEAQTWRTIKRVFFWGVAGLLTWFVLHFAIRFAMTYYGGAFIPQIAGRIFKRNPKALERAGVVFREQLDEVEDSFGRVVHAVQNVRLRNGTATDLDAELRDKTDEPHREVIRRMKKKRGIAYA